MPAARPGLDDTDACAAGTAGPPLARPDADDMARLFRALSDPTRLQILSLIDATDAGESCVCELTEAFQMTQPAISHHLRILVQAGVLNRDKRGAWAWYSLVPDTLDSLRRLLPGPAFLQPARYVKTQ